MNEITGSMLVTLEDTFLDLAHGFIHYNLITNQYQNYFLNLENINEESSQLTCVLSIWSNNILDFSYYIISVGQYPLEYIYY